MRARLTTIAIAAGLAVVVFVVGALGPERLAGRAKSSRLRLLQPADAFLAPATAAGRWTPRSPRWNPSSRRQPEDWKGSAALGIAYVQRARITADPSTYPLAQVVLARSLKLHPDGERRGSSRPGHPGRRPAPFHRRAPMGPASGEGGPVRRRRLRARRRRPAGARALRRGLRSFQRMIDIRPNLASYARVSYALELRGNVDGAIAAMRAAYDVAAGPADTAWAAAHIAKIHFGAGRIHEAEKWFRRARAADPDSMDAEAGSR